MLTNYRGFIFKFKKKHQLQVSQIPYTKRGIVSNFYLKLKKNIRNFDDYWFWKICKTQSWGGFLGEHYFPVYSAPHITQSLDMTKQPGTHGSDIIIDKEAS